MLWLKSRHEKKKTSAFQISLWVCQPTICKTKQWLQFKMSKPTQCWIDFFFLTLLFLSFCFFSLSNEWMDGIYIGKPFRCSQSLICQLNRAQSCRAPKILFWILFHLLCPVHVILPLSAYVTLQKQLISNRLKGKNLYISAFRRTLCMGHLCLSLTTGAGSDGLSTHWCNSESLTLFHVSLVLLLMFLLRVHCEREKTHFFNPESRII